MIFSLCLLQMGGGFPIGSCTYDLDAIIQASNLCPNFCPEGQANSLPFGPGLYGGNWTKLDRACSVEILKLFIGKPSNL